MEERRIRLVMLNVIFFGTSKFGIEALCKLSQHFCVKAVFTNPPKPSGRGKKLTKTPINIEAERLNLTVIHSSKPRLEDVKVEFDVGIVVAYGAIISQDILNLARYGFLNIHPSDLPKFRGASPIERTLEAGEENTRVCVIKMTPRLDDGDILNSMKYAIDKEENAIDLHKKFAQIGADLLLKAIENLTNGIEGERQEGANSSYAKKITKDELELTHKKYRANEALNRVRAFASYGFPFIFYQGKRIKILKAEVLNSPKTHIDIECLDGFLSPTLIKVEGKNPSNNFFY